MILAGPILTMMTAKWFSNASILSTLTSWPLHSTVTAPLPHALIYLSVHLSIVSMNS